MPITLVDFEQARDHLKPSSDVDDNDIQIKLEQASAIILSYLKKRAHEASTSQTIESSSVASPTVITTVSPHTFLTGATVFLSGHVDSVPNINGTHVIATPTADTFTIPVAVTTAGTGGTVSQLWTAETAPGDVKAATLLLLTHLYEHRGDDMRSDEATWKAIERLLARSRDPALA